MKCLRTESINACRGKLPRMSADQGTTTEYEYGSTIHMFKAYGVSLSHLDNDLISLGPTSRHRELETGQRFLKRLRFCRYQRLE